MSTYAGSSLSAKDSWKQKKAKTNLVDATLNIVQAWALPVLVGGYLVRRFLQNRKKAAKAPDAAGAAKAEQADGEQAGAAERKPRRDYKVKRDQEGPLLAGADDEEEVEVQPHDEVMEGYSESEVDAAGAAAAGPGGGNTAMLKMLQQMGYRVVMPKDGSGQVYLVPPGASAPGEEAIAEGDEDEEEEDEDEEEADE
ncbi:hypothetical protein HYH02_012808 [Chlamydomonas schloesseri]|uniref:Uncharacterized protein n=1 Tax=Chlamydomonas schloesseri TaxID=2026947 RepID=A0A835VYY9_9CHLO|nr:hypothetical protein HYH02_012808 [Chlamydomonas schloesseri]|eukprot:KAG2433105.1 hypothetical protein HYH02_012808 [Chlamydomonas schloesseri]